MLRARISIVIIVKNGGNVPRLLKRLAEIPKPDATEVLVVSASSDGFKQLRKDFPEIKWILYRARKGITIPEQRNVGLREAKGDVVVFIDADCIPSKEWLLKLIKPMNESNEYIVWGGVKSSDGKDMKDFVPKSKNGYVNGCGTGNVALRKHVCERIGFFDESFEYGSDNDFMWRARKSGFRIKYTPEAYVFHDEGSFLREIRRQYYYGKARVKLFRKHPDRWKSLVVLPLSYLSYLLLLPITYFFPYYPLLIFIPLLKNVRNRPFRTVSTHLVCGLGFLYEFVLSTKS